MLRPSRLLPLALLFSAACADVKGDDHDHDHENEVITTVVLSFAPQGGGDTLEFRWADPEDDGDPVIDDIVLLDADDYDLSVAFLNELEDPAEDLTEEIADEKEEHQLFFTGAAVQSAATGPDASAIVEISYADQDADGLPVGLDNTVTTMAVGSGELLLTLRHLPPESGEAVKVADLAETVASSGFGAIGGDNDVEVRFPLEVQ